MNINSRLKMIEKKVNRTISEFCLCYGENLKYEVIPITIDEWKRRFDSGAATNVRLPDFCELCRKPIDKRFIEITFEQLQKTIQQRTNQVIKTNRIFSNN